MPTRKMVARPRPNTNAYNADPPDDSPLWHRGFANWARRSNAYQYERTHPERDNSATAYAGPLALSASGHF